LDGPCKLFVSWVGTTVARTWHTECTRCVCGVGWGIGYLQWSQKVVFTLKLKTFTLVQLGSRIFVDV